MQVIQDSADPGCSCSIGSPEEAPKILSRATAQSSTRGWPSTGETKKMIKEMVEAFEEELSRCVSVASAQRVYLLMQPQTGVFNGRERAFEISDQPQVIPVKTTLNAKIIQYYKYSTITRVEHPPTVHLASPSYQYRRFSGSITIVISESFPISSSPWSLCSSSSLSCSACGAVLSLLSPVEDSVNVDPAGPINVPSSAQCA